MSKSQAERVQHLTTKYKDDFEKFFEPYLAVCREAREEPLDLSTHKFNTDEDDAAYIGLGALEEACNEHVAQIEAAQPNLKKKRREMKAENMRKAEEVAAAKETPCAKCGARKFLEISSKACDGNFCRLPNGRELEGYAPHFTVLTMLGGDGASFSLCISCGTIRDLDLAKLREEIDAAYEDLE
jgi:putative hemolysin